jgi:poly(3-hydroxybutyrate) depolymerase
MLYYLYELNHAAVAPWRAAANFGRFFWKNPGNPLSGTYIARSMAASLDVFERVTRRYGKPEFGITQTRISGTDYRVSEEVVWERPFCRLLHFRLEAGGKALPAKREKVLIVAPMSGHYATLLRGTVAAMLPHADIHITDWADARQVELSKGHFDLDDYIDYLLEMIRHLGPGSHIMAVCQPSVPVLAAVSLMNANNDPDTPASMVLMGGPIDTRRNPTAVNKLAVERGIDWFKRNVIVPVPMPHPGYMREVYPGFLQLTGFMTMNLDRHIDAHRDLFWHLVQGDGDSADKHDEFYDEYLSVMDLTAEFYLQTVEKVFIEHALARGVFSHRNTPVNPALITRTALMTVEGERDDISGVGQTEAAHDLCSALPPEMRLHHLQPRVGHYGVFNGSRFRDEIAPKIVGFVNSHAKRKVSSE